MNRKIKALLVERGIKIGDLAERAGLAISTVSGALNGHWRSRPVQEAIARELQMPLKKLERMWERKKAA